MGRFVRLWILARRSLWILRHVLRMDREVDGYVSSSVSSCIACFSCNTHSISNIAHKYVERSRQARIPELHGSVQDTTQRPLPIIAGMLPETEML